MVFLVWSHRIWRLVCIGEVPNLNIAMEDVPVKARTNLEAAARALTPLEHFD